METARRQKEAVQKKAGMLAIQNYLAGKLYIKKEKAATATPSGNIIDFPQAVREIKRIVRVEDLVFMNA